MMTTMLLFLFVSIAAISVTRSQTAAPYSNCDPPNVTTTTSPDLAPRMINDIVYWHNFYRRSTNPTAVSMPMLQWDDNLAQLGKAYVQQCGPFAHSNTTYRTNKAGFARIGENLGAGFVFSRGGFVASVKYWGDERIGYTYQPGPCSPTQVCGTCTTSPTVPECGHYTQVVWAATTRVGCAYQSCPSQSYREIYICMYGAAGNIYGQAPYQSGTSTNIPCSPTTSTAASSTTQGATGAATTNSVSTGTISTSASSAGPTMLPTSPNGNSATEGPTTAPSAAASESGSASGGLGLHAIIGIAVGGVLVLVVIIAVVALRVRQSARAARHAAFPATSMNMQHLESKLVHDM